MLYIFLGAVGFDVTLDRPPEAIVRDKAFDLLLYSGI